jgi:FAD/FMN-containing dehydrogenase
VAIELLDPVAAAELTAEAALSAPVERPVLCLGVEGSEREALWQLGELQREVAVAQPSEMTVFTSPGESARLWSALTGFQTPGDEPCSFSASLLPSHLTEFVQLAVSRGVMVQAHAASGVVVGHLSEEVTKPREAVGLIHELRNRAERGHGTLTVTHCEPAWRTQLDLFGRYDGEWTLMRRLKQTLDPRGLLSPGRLFGDL